MYIYIYNYMIWYDMIWYDMIYSYVPQLSATCCCCKLQTPWNWTQQRRIRLGARLGASWQVTLWRIAPRRTPTWWPTRDPNRSSPGNRRLDSGCFWRESPAGKAPKFAVVSWNMGAPTLSLDGFWCGKSYRWWLGVALWLRRAPNGESWYKQQEWMINGYEWIIDGSI